MSARHIPDVVTEGDLLVEVGPRDWRVNSLKGRVLLEVRSESKGRQAAVDDEVGGSEALGGGRWAHFGGRAHVRPDAQHRNVNRGPVSLQDRSQGDAQDRRGVARQRRLKIGAKRGQDFFAAEPKKPLPALPTLPDDVTEKSNEFVDVGK